MSDSKSDTSSDNRRVQVAYLDRLPTMADVIAWVISVPTIFIGGVSCPYLVTVIPKFKIMFDSLGAKLPAVTVFVMEQYWWLCTFVPIAVVIGLIITLVMSTNSIRKVTAAIAAASIVMAIFSSVIIAIYDPLLQLQSAISGHER